MNLSTREALHPNKVLCVTIPDHGSKSIKQGAVASICCQRGLTIDERLRHLDTL